MRNLLYLILLIFFISACEKEKDEKLVVPDFSGKDTVITAGYICGWCSGADSLVMAEGAYFYTTYKPCGEDKSSVLKSGSLSNTDWQGLIQLLDYETFSEIDINTCHLCADGCDKWVRIRQGDESHFIRYWDYEEDLATVEPVRSFLDKLDELKAKLESN